MAGDSKRARGGQQTPYPHKLRALVWYQHVRSLTKLSDYELNRRFAGTTESGSPRTKIFENIRLRQSVPSRGAHWRGTPDIVHAVGQEVPGSLDIYESPFWELLVSPPDSVVSAHHSLDSFMTTHGLIRLPQQLIAEQFETVVGIDTLSLYNRCLEKTLEELTPWNRMTLLGLMTREADLSGNLEITDVTRSFFDEHLQAVLRDGLEMHDCLTFYTIVVEDFIYSKRGGVYSEHARRLGFEAKVAHPILPRRLISGVFE